MTTTAFWTILDYEVPLWAVLLLLVLFYGSAISVAAWLRYLLRKLRWDRLAARDRFADIPPVKVIPTPRPVHTPGQVGGS